MPTHQVTQLRCIRISYICVLVNVCLVIFLYGCILSLDFTTRCLPTSLLNSDICVSVRAGLVLELDVSLHSVSFHKEFRTETTQHGQKVIPGQFKYLSQLKYSPSKGHFANCLPVERRVY